MVLRELRVGEGLQGDGQSAGVEEKMVCEN